MSLSQAHRTQFNDHPSERYLAAVGALQALAAAEGSSAAHAAAADVLAPLTEQTTARHFGHRTEGGCCVRRLLGQQHILSEAHPGGVTEHSDELGPPCHPPGADHPSLWIKAGHPSAYLYQPYGLPWERLRALVAFCEASGLRADVDQRYAYHYPGAVEAVLLRRAEERL